jgi:amino acid adenylation domain-containing protein
MSKKNDGGGRTGLEIAVIGMAGRFPGAANVEEFWEKLESGIECICFFNDEELKQAGAAEEILQHADYVKANGIIRDIDCFDAPYFDYTPGEASQMDPQVRIFHECAAAALEDAGVVPESYRGAIGLFAGAGDNFYWQAWSMLSGNRQFLASQLSDKDFLCTHISYKLDLKGPSSLVQTSCSTSLVAIHQACRALLTGDCKIALAGGVRAMVPQEMGYLYQEDMIYSPDGHCRAFDADARGTVAGNGAAIVVLKLLKEAIANRDHIYALIKGTAVNNDGKRKVGYSAPSVEGQADVIKTAMGMARVEPESITYIETHGTGTSLGDMVEIGALKLAFSTDKRNFCALGSVKTNVGHLDCAAGAASFIKAVLCLKHRAIPPSLHFKTPNAQLDLDNSPFYVNAALAQWKPMDGYPLRAGVSSFGIGGTNAHVILEEWPEVRGSDGQRVECPQLIVLSAKTNTALEKMTKNLAGYLKRNFANSANPVTHGSTLADAAFTLHMGRAHHRHRRMAVCSDAADAAAVFSDKNSRRVKTAISKGEDIPVIFMFPGQGSQYENMGLELYRDDPIFREAMDRCFEILLPLLGYDIKEILYPAAGNLHLSTDISRTDIAQPLIFVFEYALGKLLIRWGIKPQAMIGYSFGEYTAACLSGVFSLEDVLRLIVLRGQLMQEMPEGAMLSVPLPEDELTALLSSGVGKGITLAVVNEDSCIVSGLPEVIGDFEEVMKARRLMCVRLNIAQAGHSVIYDSAVDRFKEALNQVRLSKPEIPFISGVTGTWIKDEEARDPMYWVRPMLETIRFADGIKELLNIENPVFVEVGPGRDLSVLVRRMIGQNPQTSIVNTVPPPRKKETDLGYLLRKIGQLWLYGVYIDGEAFYAAEKRYRISLPTYSFDKRRYWLDDVSIDLDPGMAARIVAFKKPVLSVDLEDETETGEESESRERPDLDSRYMEPGKEIEKKLVFIWEDFFGIRQVGIDDDFFELGGDSLKAMTVSAEIHKELNVKVPLESFFKYPTIRELSHYIEGASEDIFQYVEPVEKKEYYYLSSGQNRLYIIQQMDLTSTAYNLPEFIPLEPDTDRDKLEETFKKLINRHESLRTSFVLVNEEPVQKIHGEVEFTIDFFDLAAKSAKEREEVENIILHFVRPFNFTRVPLLRIGLIKTADSKHLLLVDMHHIISDAVSHQVLVKEFTAFYRGETLPPLPLQYRDYSQWQNRNREQGILKKQEEYWLEEFKGELPVLNILTDYPRPVFQSFEGSIDTFTIGKQDTAALRKIAADESATLFMVLLAVGYIFLSKVSGQGDIVIGTPVAGRRHADLDRIIGPFLNTLGLRNRLSGEKTFKTFMAQVKERTLKAFDNQEYAFEDLISKIGADRDMSRNPLFDVVFTLNSIMDAPGQTEEIPEVPGKVELGMDGYIDRPSKFDLGFLATEMQGELFFMVEFCTRLFRRETVERFVRYYKKTMAEIIDNPYVKLADIELIPGEEKMKVLYDFNNTTVEDSRDKTIQVLFEGQVRKRPGNTALVFEDLCLTYKTLNERANRLAWELRSKGIGRDSIVGIMTERVPEMIIGMLAILKAGGGYLPVDYTYPAQRNEFMLEDCSIDILLTQHHLESSVPFNGEILYLDDPGLYESGSGHNPGNINTEDDLAVILYTSGSTGKPKGVMLLHRGMAIVNILYKRILEVTPNDRVLLFGSLAYDASMFEMYMAFFSGAGLYILPREVVYDYRKYEDYLNTHKITALLLPPVYLSNLQPERVNPLRVIVTGGARPTYSLIDAWKEKAQYVNAYGPTEITICCTMNKIDDSAVRYTTVPIGKPLFNQQIYILDKNLHVCPIGVAGEMYIAGDGVGRGYLNRPELTAEKFDHDLWDYQDYQDEKKNKKFLRGPGDTYSAVLNNAHGDDTSFKASYSVFALQMLPHAVGFFKRAPSRRRQKNYKTGDLGRWLPDGSIEFLGRIDQMVKIRGFRVELGEIENQLVKIEDVKEAAVVPKENELGEGYLCAYIFSDKEFKASDLREYLSGYLPDYMVPSYFMCIKPEDMPLTPSDKINKKALPDIETKSEQEYAAPRNEIEEGLAEIWSKVLAVEKEKIGINDSYFDLGGNSLKIIRINNKVKTFFNRDIPVVEMFRYTTIASQAEYLSQENKKEGLASRGIIKEEKLIEMEESIHEAISLFGDN